MTNIVTINTRKYDGSLHRSWKAELISENNGLLEFVGVFENAVVHPDLGKIRKGTVSYEYYWLDRWYNVFRFHEPSGEFRNFYCNVNLPPVFENGVLDYIDLDIDILVSRDMNFEVLDEEEYRQNSARYQYPNKIETGVRKAVQNLTDLIKRRQFPFNILNSDR